MKYKNKAKRLAAKQKAYEEMIKENPGLEKSYYKPGSIRKS